MSFKFYVGMVVSLSQ